jgi:hypothetical protein
MTQVYLMMKGMICIRIAIFSALAMTGPAQQLPAPAREIPLYPGVAP